MENRILRLPAVNAHDGLARSTRYSQIKQGLFPKPVSLGPRAVGWPESEVQAINAARIAGATDDELRRLVRELEAKRKTLRSYAHTEDAQSEVPS